MTEEAYQKLLPYLTALPVSGLGINVNMAPGPVLQSLHENLTTSQIETILQQREEEPFKNVQDFIALPQFAGLDLQGEGLRVRTFFFDVASKVTYNDRVFQLVTTVFRNAEGEMMTLRRDEGQKDLITKERFELSEG
jgi:general secretion pathway protein K